MSNGAKDLQHVSAVQQRGDDTILVFVQTDSFKPGQEVEVTVYLTQGESYATHVEKKRIPLPDDPSNSDQPATLHVELPRARLDAGQAVTVVTKVAEAWPSVVPPNPDELEKYKGIISEYDQALKAVWKYPDAVGKEPGGTVSPQP
jgi:hypothetical protein